MSGPIKTGGTAFPMQDPQAIHAYAAGRTSAMADAPVEERDRVYMQARAEAVGGMTLRDYFAAHALQGIIAKGEDEMFPVARAAEAYALADAMLKAREGGAA